MIFFNLFVGSFPAILSKIPEFDDVFDGEPPHKRVVSRNYLPSALGPWPWILILPPELLLWDTFLPWRYLELEIL